MLGSGSFGAVFLCRHVLDDMMLGDYAVAWQGAWCYMRSSLPFLQGFLAGCCCQVRGPRLRVLRGLVFFLRLASGLPTRLKHREAAHKTH